MARVTIDGRPFAPPSLATRTEVAGRRARSVTIVTLLFVAVTALSPLLAVGSALVDAARLALGRPAMAMRLAAFGWVYLASQIAAVVTLGAIWLASGAPLGKGGRRLARWTYVAQRAWARALFVAVSRLFRLRFVVEGDEAVQPAPVLVFMRHTSIVDNLLPAEFLTRAHGMPLRYVLKDDLLADPALDIAGNRLPNCFIDRSRAASAREVGRIRDLAAGLAAPEGLLIYPEGTRFTAAKHRRALARLRGTSRAGTAGTLRHVLPPRTGGPLTVIDQRPDLDVLVFAHHGLDGFSTVGDLWRGDVVGRSVTVRFWRVDHREIPTAHTARVAWLDEVWSRLDAWIADRHPSPAAS